LSRPITNIGELAGTDPANHGGKIVKAPEKISKAEEQRRARQRAMRLTEFCGGYNVGRTTAYQEIKETIITEDDAEDWLSNLPAIQVDQ